MLSVKSRSERPKLLCSRDFNDEVPANIQQKFNEAYGMAQNANSAKHIFRIVANLMNAYVGNCKGAKGGSWENKKV